MNEHSSYNQIFITEDNAIKIAFRCPGYLGTYKWVIMSFGLKNTRATNQKTTNSILHDMINQFIEVYIDDVIVKFAVISDHLSHLTIPFK